MRFVDEVKIKIAAGNGGPGCVSFRREAFAPRGGPDGGTGGAGGSVIFCADDQVSTLQDFRYKRIYQAQNGRPGMGANKSGQDGSDERIRVPIGTLVSEAESGDLLYEFLTPGEEWIVCPGGRGGKGNSHFVTAAFQAPKFAQSGELGAFLEVKLELKLLADVGIIGYPNAGKSTLISRLSSARPKIADYPFTTLTPQLGVVFGANYSDQAFVLADIPGLIEGAHKGRGLGHRFLKHIERTCIFIHLLDGIDLLEALTDSSEAGNTAEPGLKEARHGFLDRFTESFTNKYKSLREELRLFNPQILNKKEIIVFNKTDLFSSEPAIFLKLQERLRLALAPLEGGSAQLPKIFFISAVTGDGIPELLKELRDYVREEKRKLSPLAHRHTRWPMTALPDHSELRH